MLNSPGYCQRKNCQWTFYSSYEQEVVEAVILRKFYKPEQYFHATSTTLSILCTSMKSPHCLLIAQLNSATSATFTMSILNCQENIFVTKALLRETGYKNVTYSYTVESSLITGEEVYKTLQVFSPSFTPYPENKIEVNEFRICNDVAKKHLKPDEGEFFLGYCQYVSVLTESV